MKNDFRLKFLAICNRIKLGENPMDGVKLFTVGYEGKNIDEFINILRKHSIETLIDVREIPISRKKGFSKNILNRELAAKNIEYVHFKTLGSPRLLRKKVYKDGDYEYFFKKYQKYLDTCSKELKTLCEITKEKLSCLLCFERNPSYCHRNAVAQRVSSMNGVFFKVQHI